MSRDSRDRNTKVRDGKYGVRNYPLPLISDPLDSPSRTKVYTKINLRHAYHLVHIAPGDEWKTTFQTR
ncbi:hypothetical protein BS17DRAFT_784477, partial [Gyrodon lividus]